MFVYFAKNTGKFPFITEEGTPREQRGIFKRAMKIIKEESIIRVTGTNLTTFDGGSLCEEKALLKP